MGSPVYQHKHIIVTIVTAIIIVFGSLSITLSLDLYWTMSFSLQLSQKQHYHNDWKILKILQKKVMCLGTLISAYGNFLTTNHYLMTSSRPTFDPDLRNSCIRKCKKERSLLLQNWITAESSSQPHSHSSREKLHHSPLFRQNPLSNKSLKIPKTSYDKVSANTAS